MTRYHGLHLDMVLLSQFHIWSEQVRGFRRWHKEVFPTKNEINVDLKVEKMGLTVLDPL